MVEVLESRFNTVICENCGGALKYDYDDIKEEKTHMNEYNTYIECPVCDSHVSVPRRATL